jgi:seryl-tRNA synthetase
MYPWCCGYLIPTAEVPVTNMFRDVILAENGPVLTTAYTPCSVVKRVPMEHMYVDWIVCNQFDKVEIVRGASRQLIQSLDGMVEHIKEILNELKLPWILRLAVEIWIIHLWPMILKFFSTAQDRWLEISSVSSRNFQANRLKLRFKDKDGKTNWHIP